MLNPTNEEQETKTWRADVDENGILTLPQELWDLTGWQTGDVLEWIDQEDGTFLLVKSDDQDGPCEETNDAGND